MILKRTHTCGELNLKNVEQSVTLCGWVGSKRDHGGCIFVDLRDRYGITQIVFEKESCGIEMYKKAEELKNEYVIAVKGVVRDRGENRNPQLPTGEIEVVAKELFIYTRSIDTPFPIKNNISATEKTRLTYRVLDLRRPKMQEFLIKRHRINQITRNYLSNLGFLELETPFLTKSTPEGARDFLVPSRLSRGNFYALPQSPQLFKQLFMVAGLDRYFQIVKCFRDEDLRQDRQPEFTQIDLEMSFIDQEDIFAVVEGLITRLYKEICDIDLDTPFKRINYHKAIKLYGSDKPITYFGLELMDITEKIRSLSGGGVRLFENLKEHDTVFVLRVPSSIPISRTEMDKLEDKAKELGAKGLLRVRVTDSAGWSASPVAKSANRDLIENINALTGAESGDWLLFQIGDLKRCTEILGNIRLYVAQNKGLIDKNRIECLWITDFPLFELNPETGKIEPCHHPFTMPFPEDIDKLESNPLSVRAWMYDLVINGVEIGSGSIRVYDPELQQRIFRLIGIDSETAKKKFGFLLDAFKFGPPPHGGIALGMDRLVAMLVGADSIRDVIPFPKTQKGQCLLTNAPSSVDREQLLELGLMIIDKKGDSH